MAIFKWPAQAAIGASETSSLLLPHDSEVSSTTIAASEGEGAEALDPRQDRRASDAANQSVGPTRATLIILSLWALIFLQASNMSGITTTQSDIAADLDAFSQTSWFTSAYLIAMSSCSPVAGRLSQLFSPRKCLFVSAITFSIGGLITSRAPSLAIFLIGRTISGIGGAGILTISMILVLELTGRKRRGLFVGMVNAGFTTGVSLGAVIAGALLPVTGWRPLFWAQTPLGLISGTAVLFSIPKSFVSGPQGPTKEALGRKLARVDYIGAVTLISTIVLFLYGMSSAEIQWVPIITSTFLFITFVLNESYNAHVPIIPITVLKSRGILLTCVAQLGLMASRWIVLFYTPVYAIAVRGWTPASAGAMLVPTNLGFGLGGLVVGWIHVRRTGSFYLACIVSFSLFTATLFTLRQLSTPDAPATLYVCAIFLNGFCTGAALNYVLAHILHLSLAQTHFIVTSLLATFRGFAGSFGSAIGGGIFSRLLRESLEQGFADRGMVNKDELITRLLGSPALVSRLDGIEKDVAIAGYVDALRGLFMAGSMLVGVMVCVQAAAGWEGPVEEKPEEESIVGDNEEGDNNEE